MDTKPIMDLMVETGIWCVAAFAIGKIFFEWLKKIFDYLREEKAKDKEDFKEEKDKLYSLFEGQSKILEQLKELLGKQVLMSEHNRDTLDKLTEIQILHTNRLDRIEDRLGRLEDKANGKK